MVNIVTGDNASNSLFGSSLENNIVLGRGGDDSLRGSPFVDDLLFGGRGNDTLYATGGRDILRGGVGNDTYIISVSQVATTFIEEQVNSGTDTMILQSGTFFWYPIPLHVENFVIRSPVNEVTGNRQDNTIDASAISAAVFMYGEKGDDRLIGTRGGDYLDGGHGRDFLAGGNGFDYYVVDNRKDVVRENANEGVDFLESSVNWKLDANVENLVLVEKAKKGRGNDLGNSITGNDLRNVLVGGDGDDALSGGTGDDKLKGGRGEDILDGGEGRDLLIGGADSDTFLFSSVDDLGRSKRKADTVRDLSRDDNVSFFEVDGDQTKAGHQLTTYIGRDSFSGSPGEVRYKNGHLEFNLDRDARPEAYIDMNAGFAVVDDAVLV